MYLRSDMNLQRSGSGKIVVVADDFTGANDTGVQFSKQKQKSIVIINNDHIARTLLNCDVLVIDTESRFYDSKKAYIKACETGGILKNQPVQCIYKKLDSTFRGNPGAEIAGLMDSMDIRHTVLAAAFPANNRITKNGMVYINGELLEKTEFANDPRNPVKESFIPKIISGQTDKSIGLVNYRDIRAGCRHLAEKLHHLFKNGIEIIVFDVLDNNDLDMIASVTASMEERILFAGSTGFAEFVSKYPDNDTGKKISVVIAGSVSDVTRRQIDFANEKLPLTLIDADVENLLSGNRQKEKMRILDIVSGSSGNGKDVIIRSAPSGESVAGSIEYGEKSGLSAAEISEIISGFLGDVAGEIIENVPLSGIILTGGDTAISAVKALNISGTVIQEEILPGIPYGHFIEKKYSSIAVVTKAGGFGSEDALCKILEFLRKRGHRS